MGERKVVNKYYPPDFDPSKIPRRRKPKNQQFKVRTMLQTTIRCETCGSFMYEGTKINARKENVVNETYLGIQKFRFYFNCINCTAEVVMKTDPRESGYVMEAGARGRCKRWSDDCEEWCSISEVKSVVECLESRRLDSKRRMDVVASVEELRSMKARREKVSVDALLEGLRDVECKDEDEDEDEDEELIKSIFRVRRVEDDDEDEEGVKRSNVGDDGLTNEEVSCGKKTPEVRFMVKKKAIRVDNERVLVKEHTKLQEENFSISSCLESLCQYDGSDIDQLVLCLNA